MATKRIIEQTETQSLDNGTYVLTDSATNGSKKYQLNRLLTGLQTTSNLVTSVSSESTDSQYPSAKLLYDSLGNVIAKPSSPSSGQYLAYNGSAWVAVTLSTATTQSDGLMSSTDKGKLDTVYADYSSALTALGVS